MNLGSSIINGMGISLGSLEMTIDYLLDSEDEQVDTDNQIEQQKEDKQDKESKLIIKQRQLKSRKQSIVDRKDTKNIRCRVDNIARYKGKNKVQQLTKEEIIKKYSLTEVIKGISSRVDIYDDLVLETSIDDLEMSSMENERVDTIEERGDTVGESNEIADENKDSNKVYSNIGEENTDEEYDEQLEDREFFEEEESEQLEEYDEQLAYEESIEEEFFEDEEELFGDEEELFGEEDNEQSEEELFGDEEELFGEEDNEQSEEELFGDEEELFEDAEDSQSEEEPFEDAEDSQSEEELFEDAEDSQSEEEPFEDAEDSQSEEEPFEDAEDSQSEEELFEDAEDSQSEEDSSNVNEVEQRSLQEEKIQEHKEIENDTKTSSIEQHVQVEPIKSTSSIPIMQANSSQHEKNVTSAINININHINKQDNAYQTALGIENIVNNNINGKDANSAKTTNKSKKHSTVIYDSMTESKLFTLVKKFMKLKGLEKSTIDIDLLNRQFGDINIKRLIKKNFLIKIGKGVTTGR